MKSVPKRKRTPTVGDAREVRRVLQAKQRELAKYRDSLRRVFEDYEALLAVVERAEENLQCAIDALSELV